MRVVKSKYRENQVLSIWNDGGELSTEDFSHMFERFIRDKTETAE